jgi:hypothetical protein
LRTSSACAVASSFISSFAILGAPALSRSIACLLLIAAAGQLEQRHRRHRIFCTTF